MTSNDPLSGVYVKGEDDPRILLNYNPVSITNRETGQVDEHRYLGTDLTVADELTEYYLSLIHIWLPQHPRFEPEHRLHRWT